MNVLIPIFSGSEYRQFYLSGIASEIVNKGNNVYVMVKDNDETLIDELTHLDNRFCLINYYNKDIKPSLYTRLQRFLRIDYQNKFKRWNYTENIPKKKLKEKIEIVLTKLLNNTTRRALIKISNFLAKNVNVDTLSEKLSYHKIERIVMNTARTEFTFSLLVSAYQLKIPVLVLYHTFKEVFAQNRIMYPYHKIGVWNNEMKQIIFERNNLIDLNVEIIGNTHFTYLFSNQEILDLKTFKSLFGVPEICELLILYTAAGTIIENEFLIVEKIEKLLKSSGCRNYYIIVRKNPMDTSNNWENFFSKTKNVFIQVPKWVMDTEKQLNYTLKNDLIEYKSLLSYSDLIINIPSTVTIEAAIKRKPVINIAYNFPNVINKTNSRELKEFWLADYYKIFQNFDFVFPVFSEESLKDTIDKLNEIKNKKFNDFKICVNNTSQEDSLNNSIEFILN